MPSKKWLASCHCRTINTMRRKMAEMSSHWEDNDQVIVNELHNLLDHLENCENLLYFISKSKD
ncbi:hypothetical protein ACG0Z5_14485 [Scandinavium sp. M-37]|jgi:hypothetical protein|uniref:hypothetical protein n=1 Tax=Scandinavium sp. M-37 TaxID=3373077 RepID=UPI0037458715